MLFLAQDAIFIVPIFLIYLWFMKPRFQSLYLFGCAIFGLIIAYGITKFYFHPRPSMIGLGTPLFQHPPDSSFPSDHVTVLSAIAFGLFSRRNFLIGIGFLVLGILVGFARVYCGVHFPFDVIGAFAVGFLGAGLVYLLSPSKQILS